MSKTYLTSTKKAICRLYRGIDAVRSPFAIAMRTCERVDGWYRPTWVAGPSGGVREH